MTWQWETFLVHTERKLNLCSLHSACKIQCNAMYVLQPLNEQPKTPLMFNFATFDELKLTIQYMLFSFTLNTVHPQLFLLKG